jgi:Flp pilus assembly pilin Flp
MMDVFEVPLFLLQYALTQARALRSREDAELGASAIEWAIISAVVVTAAVVIGGIIYNIVDTKGKAITNCGNVTPGTVNGTC